MIFHLLSFLIAILLAAPSPLEAQGLSGLWTRKGDDAEKIDEPPSALEKSKRLFGRTSDELMSLSLDECTQRALTYSPELQIADYSVDMARGKKEEAARWGYPIIEYEYNLAPAPKDVSRAVESFFSGDLVVFNRFKLAVGVPLHTFGKVKTGQALADKGIRAEKEKKEQKKSEIVFRVKQLYHGILLAREVNRLLQSARKGVRGEVEKRETAGGSDPSELLKLKLFLADVEKRMEEGDKKEILAREALRVQLGIDPSVQFDLDTDRLRVLEPKILSYEDYRVEALESRRDLKLLDLGYDAKEKQMQLEGRLMTPNLGVGALFEIGRAPGVTGLISTDDFNDPFNYTRAGIGLQLKGQLDFHTSLAKVHQARAELYRIDVQRELAADGVELEVKEAFLDVKNTKMDVERAEEAGRLSRQLLFLTQSNYDIGLAESNDLIDALQSVLQTRGQYFESVFHFNVAVAKLEQKVGRVPK